MENVSENVIYWECVKMEFIKNVSEDGEYWECKVKLVSTKNVSADGVYEESEVHQRCSPRMWYVNFVYQVGKAWEQEFYLAMNLERVNIRMGQRSLIKKFFCTSEYTLD